MHRSLAPVAAALGALLVVISAPAVANAATLSVSDSTFGRVDASSLTRSLPIASSGRVGSVVVTVDFEKDGPQCSGGPNGSPFHGETELRLTSPSGTTVDLVTGFTYSGSSTSRVVVTFDDQAATRVGGGAPASGTFRPSSPLSAFAGQPAGGTWTLRVTDTVGSDPLCYFGSTLRVVEALPVLVAGDLPRGAEGAAYAGQLPAATAAGAVTYAATDPSALPPGLTLAPSGAITGTPTASGVYAFAVTASDAYGTSQPRTYAIVVEGPPAISGAASANATVGSAFSYAPIVDDGELATTITAEGLPVGLQVDATTGAISGTPIDVARSYGVLLTATNARGSDEHAVVIRLAAGPVASLTLAPEGSRIAEGAVVTFTATAVDAAGNPASVAGVTLATDGANDAVSGLSVVFGDAGQRTVTATDGATGVADAVTVDVLPAPVVPEGTLPSGVVGDPYAASLPDAIAEGDDVAYALTEGSALPDGLSLAADGTIEGTPTARGTTSFAVTATDEFGTSDPVTFAIVVQQRAAIAGPATATAAIATAFSYVPELEPGDPAATVTTAEPLPAWLTLDPATGALTGLPTGELGPIVVTLVADNGLGADELEVTIDVVAGSVVTLALTPTSSTIGVGSAIDFVVTGFDVEGNAVDVDGEATLTSDVATDRIDGLRVTFPTASTHTITAEHGPTGATATATVEVLAAPVPSAPAPSAPAPSAPGLPVTGADSGIGGALLAFAVMLLVVGAALGSRRRA